MQKLLVFYIIAMMSCNSNKGIVGSYQSKTVTLKMDTGYRFSLIENLSHSVQYTTKGKWNQDDKFIYLNSDPEVTSSNGKVIESFNSGQIENIIEFKTSLGNPYSDLLIKLNDSLKMKTDSSGLIRSKEKINSFFVIFEPDIKFYYKPKSASNNFLSVRLEPNNRWILVLINEKYRLKGNKIIRLQNGSKYTKKNIN